MKEPTDSNNAIIDALSETEITKHHLEEIKFHGINADDKELERFTELFFEGVQISENMDKKYYYAEYLQSGLQKQSGRRRRQCFQ